MTVYARKSYSEYNNEILLERTIEQIEVSIKIRN